MERRGICVATLVVKLYRCEAGDYKTKKLIVSRQPIFTNLKSNTMKNDAKVWLSKQLCKQKVKKILEKVPFLFDSPAFVKQYAKWSFQKQHKQMM